MIRFKPEFKSSIQPPLPSWWLIFSNNRLLIKSNQSELPVPFLSEPFELNLVPIRSHYLGELNGAPCYCTQVANESEAPDGMIFTNIRALFGKAADDFVALAGQAGQILRWDEAHQYCGRCGGKMSQKQDERAKMCPSCGLINYPRLSPAIIVAVTKGHQILLAQSTRYAANFYSVLAGFVEPGETLEACVQREVREEVGIQVKEIAYFGSQPWPYPDSLMLGFTAVYKSGDITINPKEISAADWFNAENLPETPGKFSIAGKLIDWFVQLNKGEGHTLT